ncbi:MAG: hypothetical protein WCT37_00360 [Patescibacteria group bacterium]
MTVSRRTNPAKARLTSLHLKKIDRSRLAVAISLWRGIILRLFSILVDKPPAGLCQDLVLTYNKTSEWFAQSFHQEDKCPTHQGRINDLQ